MTFRALVEHFYRGTVFCPASYYKSGEEPTESNVFSLRVGDFVFWGTTPKYGGSWWDLLKVKKVGHDEKGNLLYMYQSVDSSDDPNGEDRSENFPTKYNLAHELYDFCRKGDIVRLHKHDPRFLHPATSKALGPSSRN